ncbi:PAS domain S-box-containing protein [Algoriphagus ornithinivorans]|uniref:histidine kinase n=1 Tax=Algoriphagus ornithinivorans TaxID=226506 RepID=A0A1I5C5H6_9BACT|nr:PAS domain S-box protein [Algoriphagus ornithinivorans]SFN82330.1 PAS domain S-box-containing protein [Algoriphagus ornithinivorans]
MSQFHQFDISDFFNEINEPLFLMDSEEIIFWNNTATENFKNLPEDWKAWISNEELEQKLLLFFKEGILPQITYFKSLEKKCGEFQRFEWVFVNLPSSYSSRFLIVKANPIKFLGNKAIENSILNKQEQTVGELSYIQSILHHSHDLIAILDEQGNYKFISDSVVQKIGFPVDYIVGKNFRDFIEEGIIELVKGSFEEVLDSTEEVAVDFWINRSKGKRIYLESFAKNLIYHPEINGVLFSSRDITDFIETDRSLQKRYEIENLINQVSSRLINRRLSNLEEDFQEFLRKFSHFLRAHRGVISIFNQETQELDIINTWSLSSWKSESEIDFKAIIDSRKKRLEAGIVKLIDLESEGFESTSRLILIPMISASKILGVIYFEIDQEDLEFTEKELQIFRQLGDILAGAYIGSLMTRRIERNENLLATTERLSKSGSWRYSTTRNLFYISGGLARIFDLGIQPVTAEFSSLILRIDKSYREDFVKNLKRSIKEKSHASGEFTIRNEDGKLVYISYEIETKQDFFTQGIEVNGFCTDITHKRASEEYLRLQSQILAQVNDPILVTNLEYQIIYLNKAAVELCGMVKENAYNEHIDSVIKFNFPDGSRFEKIGRKLEIGDVKKQELFIETGVQPKAPFEISMQAIHADGKEKIGYSLILRDLSEKYENERLAMRASMIVENSPAVLFQVDPNDDYRIYYISENINQFGYQSKELMENRVPFLDIVHPDDAKIIKKINSKSRGKSGVVSFSGEYRIKKTDGTFIWVEDKTTDVRNEVGDIILHQGLFQDITERKNFEEFKEEKEKQYRVLASNIPGTNIFLLDKSRKYILAEGTNFENWGLSPSDFEGNYLTDIALTDSKEVSKLLDRVYEKREIVETEFFLRGRRYHRVIRPILEYGKVEYALSIVRDITEEHKAKEDLRQSEEKYRTLVEESTEIIFSLSESFIVDYISPNVKQFMGYEMDEVIGKSVFEFLDPEDLDVFQVLLEETKDFFSQNQFLEFKLRHKNGEYRVFNSNGKVILDKDGKRLYTGIARDISKLKEAQRELLKAKEKAEQASLIKSQFLSVMSHEIRTPMNAVIGLAHFLLEDDPKPDQLENLKTLQFSAESLMALINDILDYNKIDSGKIELEEMPFDLKNFIQRIVHSHSFQATEKSLYVISEIDEALPKSILADSVRLGQIVNNLVSNAIKFTEKGGVKIILKSEGIDIEGKAIVKFRFEDTGIGIPEEKVSTIFEAFTQASSETTRKYGGTGLGLAIVKRLVELYQGDITYSPNLGGGSVFEFVIHLKPFEERANNGSAEDKPQIKSLMGASILVAEDNMVNQILIQKFLKKWNTGNVVVASDGQEALEFFEKEHFDLILLDLQMPIYDGFTVAKKIRSMADPVKSKVPMLALTATSLHEVKEQLMEVGVNDYVAKPFTPENLYEKLLKFLRPKERV